MEKLVIRVRKGLSEAKKQQLKDAVITHFQLTHLTYDQAGAQDTITFQEYDPQYPNDDKQDYMDRMQSIADAIEFLLAAEFSDTPHSSKIIRLNNLTQHMLKEFKARIENSSDKFDEIYNLYLRQVTDILKENHYPTKSKIEINHIIDRAEQYLLLTKPRPIICTLVNDIVITDKPLPALKNEALKVIPPHLEPIEKRLYQNAIDKINKDGIKAQQLSLSSRLDSIAGPRNFWHETVHTLNNDGSLTLLTEQHRLSIIGSRSQSNEVNEQIARESFETALQQSIIDFLKKNPNWDKSTPIPAVYMTLITPLAFKKDDYELYQLKLKIIEEFKQNGSVVFANGFDYQVNLIEVNFSINLGRHFLPTLAGTTNYDACFVLIDIANSQLLKEGINQQKLLAAISELKKVLNMDYTQVLLSPAYKRELHIASLMHIIANEVGVSLGGCMSAKDREAIKDIYVPAMESYFDEHKNYPSYFDKPESEARKDFVSRMANLYGCGHQQELTEKNANGARGIKTPEMYLPYDVSRELKKRHGKDYLKKQDGLASTNDCHKEIQRKNNSKSVPNIVDNEQITELQDLYHFLLAKAQTNKFSVRNIGFFGGEHVTINGKNAVIPEQVRKTLSFIQKRIQQQKTIEECANDLRRLSRDFERKANQNSIFSFYRTKQTREIYKLTAKATTELLKNIDITTLPPTGPTLATPAA